MKNKKKLLLGGFTAAVCFMMSCNAFAANPYMSYDEYAPDCEPRLFNGRVYVYGSHDVLDYYGGGCAGNYITYSAPADDLTDWTDEGVIYDKTEDPGYQPGMNMLAPDCVEKDGKYYLFYAPVMNTDGGKVAVAVSDSPAGPFSYYGKVAYEDGTAYDVTFDPAVLVDDDGRNYLYTGGTSQVVELDDDMLTIIGDPVRLVPRSDEDASTVGCITNYEELENHCFFEASSIRKINGTYYLIWANEQIYQLSYATGDSPTGPFTYRGEIISNDGKLSDEDEAVYPYGNIHGGILEIEDNYYIFYHRQSNGVESRFWSARQDCIEPIEILEDGSIPRVEFTSQGVETDGIDAYKEISSFVACYLKPGEEEAQTSNNGYGPYTKQFATNLHGISNLTDGSIAGYKYLNFGDNEEALELTVSVRVPEHNGTISVYIDAPNEEGKKIGELAVTYEEGNKEFRNIVCPVDAVAGKHAVYFVFDITDDGVDETETLCDVANFQFYIPEPETENATE